MITVLSAVLNEEPFHKRRISCLSSGLWFWLSALDQKL